jgi:serine/threonine protein kinase
MFRDAGPVPVLTDFGIVRDLNAPTLTADFMAMGPGTPAYAAPEQLTNEKALIDWRTDQFGLALVLAQCVLGRHPYLAARGGNIRDAIMRVAAKQQMADGSREQLTAAGFGGLVRALDPWPVGRYRRPEDLVAALA